MTKRRPPLSFSVALERIAGQLPGGSEEMAAVANRAPRTVRGWIDPETDESCPVSIALELDLAYQSAGGEGAPMFEAYAAQIEVAAARRFGSQRRLLDQTADVVREGGEAHAALIAACQPDAGPEQQRAAHKEACEALESLKKAIAMTQPVPTGQGP